MDSKIDDVQGEPHGQDAIVRFWTSQEEARRRLVEDLPVEIAPLERAAIATYYTLFPYDTTQQHWNEIDEGARTIMRRIARANAEALQGVRIASDYASEFQAFQDQAAEPAVREGRQVRRPLTDPALALRSPETIVAEYLARVPEGQRGINFGCGGMTFQDWLNVDEAQPHHLDIVSDLKKGMPYLPAGAFDVAYSEAFLEHVSRRHAALILKDVFRALRPGGHLRIAIPDLASWIRLYLVGARDPVDAGGQILEECGEVFGTRCELFNVAMRAWGHSYMYDRDEINRLFKSAGFVDIRACEIRMSTVPMLHDRENRPRHEVSLITEGTKPG